MELEHELSMIKDIGVSLPNSKELKELNELIDKNRLVSIIFWGAPGTGKTTLVRIIADNIDSFIKFFFL